MSYRSRERMESTAQAALRKHKREWVRCLECVILRARSICRTV